MMMVVMMMMMMWRSGLVYGVASYTAMFLGGHSPLPIHFFRHFCLRCIGSQWSFLRPGVTWSLGRTRRLSTGRTAAFWHVGAELSVCSALRKQSSTSPCMLMVMTC